MPREIPLVLPRAILLEEFMKPLGVTPYRLAKEVGVPPRRISEIVHGKRAITADTALRLAAFFRTDAENWFNLQTHYDLEAAREGLAATLAGIRPDAADDATRSS